MHNAKIEWFIPDRVIYIGWGGNVTLQSVKDVSCDVCGLMSTATGKVHLLNDARAVTHYPVNVMQIRRAMVFLNHSQLDWLVSITPPGFVAFLADAVPQMLMKTKSRAFTQMDLALEHLQFVDRSLNINRVNHPFQHPVILTPPNLPEAASNLEQ